MELHIITFLHRQHTTVGAVWYCNCLMGYNQRFDWGLPHVEPKTSTGPYGMYRTMASGQLESWMDVAATESCTSIRSWDICEIHNGRTYTHTYIHRYTKKLRRNESHSYSADYVFKLVVETAIDLICLPGTTAIVKIRFRYSTLWVSEERKHCR